MISGISSIYSTASYGLTTATNQFNTTAEKIAGFGTDTADTNDLAQNAVDLLSEKTTYKANALVLKTANQMLGTLLDVFDSPKP